VINQIYRDPLYPVSEDFKKVVRAGQCIVMAEDQMIHPLQQFSAKLGSVQSYELLAQFVPPNGPIYRIIRKYCYPGLPITDLEKQQKQTKEWEAKRAAYARGQGPNPGNKVFDMDYCKPIQVHAADPLTNQTQINSDPDRPCESPPTDKTPCFDKSIGFHMCWYETGGWDGPGRYMCAEDSNRLLNQKCSKEPWTDYCRQREIRPGVWQDQDALGRPLK
jgi:hypothetical protein